ARPGSEGTTLIPHPRLPRAVWEPAEAPADRQRPDRDRLVPLAIPDLAPRPERLEAGPHGLRQLADDQEHSAAEHLRVPDGVGPPQVVLAQSFAAHRPEAVDRRMVPTVEGQF